MKRNTRTEALAALVTALILVLTACPASASTVVRKQYQNPKSDPTGQIKVERWCLHVQPPQKDAKVDIICKETPLEYNRYSVGDKYPK